MFRDWPKWEKARLDEAFARLGAAGLVTFDEASQMVTFDPWFQWAYVA